VREKEGTCTGSGESGWAVGCLSCWAERDAPRPFSIFFSFSAFLFSDYFITFSFVLQIDSNQFLKFAKIQSNNLGQ
jgi:hypothetical protein